MPTLLTANPLKTHYFYVLKYHFRNQSLIANNL